MLCNAMQCNAIVHFLRYTILWDDILNKLK